MKIFVFISILFSTLAHADIAKDQIPTHEARTIAASEEIKELIAVLGNHHHADCPAYQAEDVKIEIPDDPKAKRHNFSLQLTCVGTFGEPDKQVNFAGSVFFVGGDLDISLYRLESMQIMPIIP